MERLSRDLSIYSMGLFPLLGHSAMSVRPKLFGMSRKNLYLGVVIVGYLFWGYIYFVLTLEVDDNLCV